MTKRYEEFEGWFITSHCPVQLAVHESSQVISERCDIYVLDLFSLALVCFVIQCSSVGSTPKERFARIQQLDEVEGRQKLLETKISLHLPVPVSFPLFNDGITKMLEEIDLLTGGLIDLLQGPVRVDLASAVTSLLETPWTLVPETSMKLKDSVCRWVVAVHVEETRQTPDVMFPTISRVANAVSHRLASGGTSPPELMLTPGQPLEGFDRLVSAGTMPTTRRFHGNSLLWQHHFPPVAVARRGNCYALFHRIKFPFSTNSNWNAMHPAFNSFMSEMQ